jgi:hypothetical protein
MNSLSRYDDILTQIPEYGSFLTVDELEASTDDLLAAHPEVRAWQCGTSRAGQAMRCLEVGDGPLRAVLAGLPHPEEPFGTLVIEYLLRLLVETDLAERLGYRFSIVKAADPDGARVNEPWYGSPYDMDGYLDRVYRPATYDQFEWTFPFAYKGYAYTKPLPEAAALKAVIDAAPLDLIMCLHNSGFSGAYFYISEDDDDLRGALTEAATNAGLPLHRGEPEVPYLVTLGDAVYKQFGLREEYDYLVENGQNPAVVLDSGTSSDDYAAALWDAFSIVAEVPAFTSDKAGDVAPAGVTRAEAKLRGIAAEQGHVDWLRARYPEAAARLSRETPWLRTVNSYLVHAKTDLAAERRLVAENPEFEREATVAELFDSVYLRDLATLHKVAQFASMIESEDEPGESLAEMAAEARARVRERASQLRVAGGLRPVPLKSAVQVQLAALLCALEHTRDRFRRSRPRPAVARSITPGEAVGGGGEVPDHEHAVGK